MNMNLVSVIIATFNSERLLPRVLDSVAKQTYPSSKVEILVIDGGSADKTREIAQFYGCRVIDNPKTLPAWAKYIGYMSARGTYAMYLDSDEIIENPRSIERKIKVFQTKSSVHAVTGSGYRSPEGVSFINNYINEFGDPFSFFMYRLSKDHRFFITSMKAKYTVVEENDSRVIFDFSASYDLPIFELVAMGSIVDLNYLKTNFPNIIDNPGLIPHLFYLLVSKGSHIAITKHDALIHYSSDTLGKYLGKILSRIVNNVFTPANEGFSGRNEFVKGTAQYKKYLFLPYGFSIVFPLIDALYLSFTRKNFGYLVHVPLCFSTASLIVYYACLRMVGYRPILKSYGQAKPVTS